MGRGGGGGGGGFFFFFFSVFFFFFSGGGHFTHKYSQDLTIEWNLIVRITNEAGTYPGMILHVYPCKISPYISCRIFLSKILQDVSCTIT